MLVGGRRHPGPWSSTSRRSPTPRLLDSSTRAGIDIGGTFTDLVVYDDASGAFVVGKTLTTPDDPSVAIEAGLDETLASANAAMDALGQIIHGTTLVTNALIERKGAPTALLASEGFRDSLEIGREHRYDLYDLQLEMPRPLVPRELRFDVPGRTLANGATLAGHDLDEAYVERLARRAAPTTGIEAVAIAFLNSFANPELERRAGAAVLRRRRSCACRSPPTSCPRSASTSGPRPRWPTSTCRRGWSGTCAIWRSGWRGWDSAARSCS